MSIQVAVRVRPFNQREINLDSQLCVEMEDKQTILLNIENESKNKTFTFDYSFWSHDGFEEKEGGLLVKKSDKYADQDYVFKCLGEDLLQNAYNGYHCTLFAYGQTGSGKSYSVMGYKPNIGIVPIACQQIFKYVDQQDQKNTSFQISFAMMEIYNEKAQDLFVPANKRPQNGLKIRESQTLGFYAEGQKKYPVRSFEEIESRIEEGSKNRSIAATLMNSNSSRAHTIITIEIKQITINGKKKSEKFSLINLVDLAGSEKVGKTGAEGDRLKEATNINKSLSTLGNVISTLAELETQKGKSGKQVPYRDSTLTKILKNALGGNSKTIMICSISPANDNYEETLSTLRYADQAKKIKNKAIVNESTSDKIVRDLQNENQKLKDLIQEFELKMKNGGNLNQNLNNDQQNLLDLQLRELEEQMNANKQLLEEQKKTYEEKILEFENDQKAKTQNQLQDSLQQVDTNKPHLSNLNEDPQLCFQVKYSLNKDRVVVGRKKGVDDNNVDIQINGLGIKPLHCIFTKEGKNIFLQPNPQDISTGEHLHLNGDKVMNKIKIMNFDRIIFGQSATFIVVLPQEKSRDNKFQKINELSWDFAQDEYMNRFNQFKEEEQKQIENKINQNMEEKVVMMEEIYQLQIELYEKEIKKQQEDYEQKLIEVYETLEGKNNELLVEQLKKQIKDNKQQKVNKIDINDKIKQKQNKLHKTIHKEDNSKEAKLNKLLTTIMVKVESMNLIAEEFNRNIKFLVMFDDNDNILVRVENNDNHTRYQWKYSTVMNKATQMQDYFDDYNESGQLPIFTRFNDPFLENQQEDMQGLHYEEYLNLQKTIKNEQSSVIANKNQPNNKKNLKNDKKQEKKEKQIKKFQVPQSYNYEEIKFYQKKQFLVYMGILILSLNFNQFDAFIFEQDKYDLIVQQGEIEFDLTSRDIGMGYFIYLVTLIIQNTESKYSKTMQQRQIQELDSSYFNNQTEQQYLRNQNDLQVTPQSLQNQQKVIQKNKKGQVLPQTSPFENEIMFGSDYIQGGRDQSTNINIGQQYKNSRQQQKNNTNSNGLYRSQLEQDEDFALQLQRQLIQEEYSQQQQQLKNSKQIQQQQKLQQQQKNSDNNSTIQKQQRQKQRYNSNN